MIEPCLTHRYHIKLAPITDHCTWDQFYKLSTQIQGPQMATSKNFGTLILFCFFALSDSSCSVWFHNLHTTIRSSFWLLCACAMTLPGRLSRVNDPSPSISTMFNSYHSAPTTALTQHVLFFPLSWHTAFGHWTEQCSDEETFWLDDGDDERLRPCLIPASSWSCARVFPHPLPSPPSPIPSHHSRVHSTPHPRIQGLACRDQACTSLWWCIPFSTWSWSAGVASFCVKRSGCWDCDQDILCLYSSPAMPHVLHSISVG